MRIRVLGHDEYGCLYLYHPTVAPLRIFRETQTEQQLARTHKMTFPPPKPPVKRGRKRKNAPAPPPPAPKAEPEVLRTSGRIRKVRRARCVKQRN